MRSGAPAGKRGAEILTATERNSERVIARLRAATGQHEIANAREPAKSFGAAALGEPQSNHLGEPAGDQRGAGILAQSAALKGPARDRQHVLHCAADFGSGRIV